MKLLPTLARAFGVPERTERERHRVLRAAGHLPGTGKPGRAAPRATPRDLAVVTLAHLSGDHPMSAARDFARSLGLVAATDGKRGYLLEALEAAYAELVEHGELPGVLDLRLAVSRPWPYARLRLAYADGSEAVAEFHHEEARKTGHPARDRAMLDTLIRQWRYKPGTTRWGEIGLPQLKLVADVHAGRLSTQEATAPPMGLAAPEPALWN